MLHYSRLQLITIVAVPIVTTILLWAIVIFHKNRKKWRRSDLVIVALLVQSVFRNVSIICYTVLQMVDQNDIRFDYCSIFVWIFNSMHTFQASTLTTLAVIGLFTVKLCQKKDNLKNYLTSAHLVYHLCCLTTLCACVGVAAILAKQTHSEFTINFDHFPLNLCKFMPYEMDVKYNVFIIILHLFLAAISLVCFVSVCYHFYVGGKDGLDYLKKSNSDLSELSLGLTSTNYYDTYAAPKSDDDAIHDTHFQVHVKQPVWNGNVSNVSTTISSTNSRRPCLSKQESGSKEETDRGGVGLETIMPILTVCYLFNHAPIIILCLLPWVLSPWSVSSAALCLGLLQDVLVPLSLALVDVRFCQWISNVYRCNNRHNISDKLPQVGVDGKFRPFASQPQSSDISRVTPDHHQSFQPTTEPKFPITNGSLYTSIDGRLPIIHNYRRHKGRGTRSRENNLVNLGAHATYLKQQGQHSCTTCENFVVRQVDTSGISDPPRADESLYLNGQRPVLNKNVGAKKSLSQSNLTNQGSSYKQTMLHIRNLRHFRSHDGLDEVGKISNAEIYPRNSTDVDNSDSEDDCFSESMIVDSGKNFDSTSSKSSFSITTEANCDFDFYQLNQDVENNNRINFVSAHGHQTFAFLKFDSEGSLINHIPRVMRTFKPQMSSEANVTSVPVIPDGTRVIESVVGDALSDLKPNFKITRSNSKRSLESFRAFLNDNEFSNRNNMQRSFSYLALDGGDASSRGNYYAMRSNEEILTNRGGSVPDFKRIFISEYL